MTNADGGRARGRGACRARDGRGWRPLTIQIGRSSATSVPSRRKRRNFPPKRLTHPRRCRTVARVQSRSRADEVARATTAPSACPAEAASPSGGSGATGGGRGDGEGTRTACAASARPRSACPNAACASPTPRLCHGRQSRGCARREGGGRRWPRRPSHRRRAPAAGRSGRAGRAGGGWGQDGRARPALVAAKRRRRLERGPATTVGTVHTRFVKKGEAVNISSPRAGDSLRAPWGAFGDARGDTAGSRQHFDARTPDGGRLAPASVMRQKVKRGMPRPR